MKVVIIMPLAEQRGGGEKRLWDLIEQGRNLGIEWLVIFQQNGPMVEQLQTLGAKVHVVQAGRLRELHRLAVSVTKIASIVRRESADVVLSWMWTSHFYGCPAAILAGVPSLWSQLEIPGTSQLRRIVNLLPACGVLTNSKAVKAAQERLWPRRPTRLVYPGVALHNFNPDTLPPPIEARRKLGLPLEGPLIGIVGRLQRWKGIHTLVEAMPKILQKYSNAHCVVVGGKHYLEIEYENYLEERIAALELDNRVILPGMQRNVPEWMQAMDIIVHASDNEPFGIVVVEAMALGKPVVASSSGGPTEVITEGVDGLLTPYGDVDALANAILCYLDNQEFAHRIGVAARERALDFSTQHYAQNFVEAVHYLVSSAS